MWVKGDVVVRGRADLVEEILGLPGDPACCYCSDFNSAGLPCLPGKCPNVPRWHLRALYLGKAFSTEIMLDDMSDARAATPADHKQARAYADRFKETEESSENAGIQTSTCPPNAPPQLELFPSPAGEGEPGSPGSARSARVREAPSGGRSAAPADAGGEQLELPRKLPTLPPVETLACAYCGRRAFERLATPDGPEPRCAWHLQGPEARLPADVRRASRG